MKELSVAPAGASVAEPTPFNGTIRAIDMLTVTREDKTVDIYYSIDIPELPPLHNDGKRVSILRTPDQLRKDLKFFASPNDTNNDLALVANAYAVGQPVSMMVSAHQAGALAVVTSHNKVAIANGKVEGEEIETSSAGFYVDGFLNVAFDKNDLREALQQSRNAQAKAVRGAI